MPADSERLHELRRRAEAGDTEAQFLLGCAYHQSDNVARDYGQALHWFRLAAEQGHLYAQGAVGVMHE